MEVQAPVLVVVLLAILAVDTVACAVPIKYIKDDLTRLNVSDQTQRAIPIVKAVAVVGLLVGLWVPLLGVAACLGMVGYFGGAFWVHKRENDPAVKYLPAAGFTLLVIAVFAFSYFPVA